MSSRRTLSAGLVLFPFLVAAPGPRKPGARADDATRPALLPPEAIHPLPAPLPLPDVGWSAFDASGGSRVQSLAAMRGRPVLLNVWARWCAPCLRELPALDRLAAGLAPRGVDVIALCLERAATADIARFLAGHGAPSLRPAVDPDGAATRALGVAAIPVTLLIDRQGRLVARADGPIDWDRARDRVVALLG